MNGDFVHIGGFHRNFLCNKKSILISKNALNFIIKSIYKGYTFKTTYKNLSTSLTLQPSLVKASTD